MYSMACYEITKKYVRACVCVCVGMFCKENAHERSLKYLLLLLIVIQKLLADVTTR